MARSGLTFNAFAPRHSQSMKGGAGAAGSTLADNFAALESTKPDVAGMGAGAVEAESYKRRMAQKANATARADGLAAIGSVQAFDKKMTAAEELAADRASSSSMGSIVKAGTTLLGAVALSDKTTKNTIENIENAMTTLRELRPVTFYYNEEYSSSPERLHYGFIAQEYIKVLPDATYYDEGLGKMCIDTSELIGLLVRAVQELESKVTRIEAANALVGV